MYEIYVLYDHMRGIRNTEKGFGFIMPEIDEVPQISANIQPRVLNSSLAYERDLSNS